MQFVELTDATTKRNVIVNLEAILIAGEREDGNAFIVTIFAGRTDTGIPFAELRGAIEQEQAEDDATNG